MHANFFIFRSCNVLNGQVYWITVHYPRVAGAALRCSAPFMDLERTSFPPASRSR
jgi:hypothetical protein